MKLSIGPLGAAFYACWRSPSGRPYGWGWSSFEYCANGYTTASGSWVREDGGTWIAVLRLHWFEVYLSAETPR